MRATPSEMAVAPELGVLAALDAVLATAAFQLATENPDLGLDALARGHPPSPEARKASFLIMTIGELRTAIRDYRDLTLHGARTDIPF